jgi:hypothetical protein
MPIYFLVHEAGFYHQQLAPALAASWRLRSFEPCRPLAASLLPAAAAFARQYHINLEEPFLAKLDSGFPFDRDLWRWLVGEILLYGAREIPEIQTAPETLVAILDRAPNADGLLPRSENTAIRQAHFGSRDVVFGGAYYRPEHAGLNDFPDVDRLARYLEGIDPGEWTVTDLASLPGMSEEERADELEFARDWFPVLRDLYQRARSQQNIIVCETIEAPPSGL